MKMKTIGLGLVAIIGTIILLGYPIVISTFFLWEGLEILKIILYLVTAYAFVRLIIWLISRFMRMIRGKSSS